MHELKKGSAIPGWLVILVPVMIISLLVLFEGPPWIKQISADSSRGEALNLIDAGKQLLKEGKTAEAFLQINGAIQMCPDFAEAHLSMGLLLSTTGHKREAIQSFEKAVALTPTKKEILYNNTGLIYYDLGEYEKAREMFYKSTASGLRPAKIWRNVGMVEEKLGNKEGIIRAYLNAIGHQPTLANLYMDMLKESSDEAVYAWCMDTIKSLLDKGLAGVDLNRYDSKIVDHYLSQNAGLTSDYLNLALAYESTQEYNDALYYFEAYLRRQPKDLATRNRMGVTLARLGRFSEAERIFLQTLQQDPDNVGARKALELLYGSTGSDENPTR